MKTLSLFLLGACLVGAQTLTPKTPYVMDSNGIYYIPSANMQSTTYSLPNTTSPTFDSRPCGGSASPSGYTPIEGSKIRCIEPSSSKPAPIAYVIQDGSGYSFVGNTLLSNPTTQEMVEATFSCSSETSVTTYGTGCGIYLWNSTTNQMWTMSYYNTTSGSSVVIQTWCYDPTGSACGGSTTPVWQNNNLGTFPVSNGIQTFRIETQNLNGTAINFGYSTDGVTWSGFGGLPLVWGDHGGVFVNTGTIMSIYALGGLN